MVELQEANLSRIVMHATKNEICFISAYRGSNSAEVNAKLTEELEKDIRVLGYGFIQVKGGYTENAGTPNEHDVYETSLAVINYKDHTYHKDFAKDMLYFCGKYKQECILLKAPGYALAWYDKDGNAKSPLLLKLTTHDLEQGFSKIHGHKFAFIKIEESHVNNHLIKQNFAAHMCGHYLKEAINKNIYSWEQYFKDKDEKANYYRHADGTSYKGNI